MNTHGDLLQGEEKGKQGSHGSNLDTHGGQLRGKGEGKQLRGEGEGKQGFMVGT